MKTITVDCKKKMSRIDDLFGIFFEDINHAADGGMYAELVQNRSFEFDKIDNPAYNSLTAWEKVEFDNSKSNMYVEDKEPFSKKNPHYLVIELLEGKAGITNTGFNGIYVKANDEYLFSCYVKSKKACTLEVYLENENKKIIAKDELTINGNEWTKYLTKLVAGEASDKCKLLLVFNGENKVCLDFVSLFPKNTYKNRVNGMREDIAQLLADMKPKFMRFPGGCLVHDGSICGDDRDSMYRWKNTIGMLEERPARRSNWRYNQTLGLGYYEYFLFCEDIGAKPLPVLPAGYDPHHKRIVPLDELQTWIDDALDLIEFANGDISTVWGAKRAELGHERPFNLEYLAIGNEEVGAPFFERYELFHKAIKEKYPNIKLINSSGPFASGGEYDRGWKSAIDNKSDLVDEHYYQSPEWFLANYHRYDSFKAENPKVFLGEYASWGNTFYNALVEAAYMTGLQNNAHAVGLACYAPMLCNVDYVNWRPDMIWFNQSQVYGTANYYVQKLFMKYQGDVLLKTEFNGFKVAKAENKAINGPVVLTANNSKVVYKDVKIINKDSMQTKGYGEFSVSEKSERFVVDTVNYNHYEVSMKATMLEGSKGFLIQFGVKDLKNMCWWELAGWQNQDSTLCSSSNGRNACLTQNLFTVEKNREYDLRLEVDGRKIRAYVDDVLISFTEDKLPEIEELYVTSSLDETNGDIIIKAVNVNENDVEANIELDAGKYSVQVFEMSGYDLDEKNSFENPKGISPIEKRISLEYGEKYTFPKRSITVLVCRQETI